MTPYYQDEAGKACACGCGAEVSHRRRFVSGHNLRGLRVRDDAHRAAIAAGQRRAWAEKRGRFPLGATRKDSHGYVVVKTRVGQGRWEKEHALVVEREIGRRVFPGEVVHHINAIRDDNRPENLFLCRDVTEHNKAHASFERLVDGLLRDGIVRFNRETGEYERCR